MTSKQRVITSLMHKEPDRVPLGELTIHSPISSAVLGREAITGVGGTTSKLMIDMFLQGARQEFLERFQKDTAAIHEALGLDIIIADMDIPIKSSTRYRYLSENRWVTENEAYGVITEFELNKDIDVIVERSSSVKNFKAINDLVEKMEKEKIYCDDSQFETIKYFVENNKEKFIIGKIPNLFPIGTSWFTLFLEAIYLEPETVDRLLIQYLERAKFYANKMLEIGVDCILNSGDWAYNTGPFVSPAKVKELFIPQVKAIAELCHNQKRYFMKHTDGNIMPIADEFFKVGFDIFQAIEPRAGMSLARLKKEYGKTITLMGNVDCNILETGNKKEIEEETIRTINDGAIGGGYILSSSNSIYSTLPPQNVLAMIETAKKYAIYPIVG